MTQGHTALFVGSIRLMRDTYSGNVLGSNRDPTPSSLKLTDTVPSTVAIILNSTDVGTGEA